MKINSKKTKAMMVEKNSTSIRFSVDGEMLQVEEFKCLGSLLSANGYFERDIRIEMAKR